MIFNNNLCIIYNVTRYSVAQKSGSIGIKKKKSLLISDPSFETRIFYIDQFLSYLTAFHNTNTATR